MTKFLLNEKELDAVKERNEETSKKKKKKTKRALRAAGLMLV